METLMRSVNVVRRAGRTPARTSGGAVRVGIVHHNTADEVNRLLSELETV
jgi:selenocysteine lyase/cysteine desulfurase